MLVLQPLREKCAGETDAAKKTFLQATLVSSVIIDVCWGRRGVGGRGLAGGRGREGNREGEEKGLGGRGGGGGGRGGRVLEDIELVSLGSF